MKSIKRCFEHGITPILYSYEEYSVHELYMGSFLDIRLKVRRRKRWIIFYGDCIDISSRIGISGREEISTMGNQFSMRILRGNRKNAEVSPLWRSI